MTSGSLDAAYAPFIASLLAGGFSRPADDGWPAELIAAHVARNNDLIAETAEQVAAGLNVSCDNAATVDRGELASYADSVGGLAGLAREVERSATRLAAAADALGGRAGTAVHVLIRDNGEIVQDGPIPIGAFIEGNATFHLDLHLDQLKSLEPVREPGPPTEFDSYQLVLLVRAPDAPVLNEAASTALNTRHLGHFDKMRLAGYLRVAGPIDGDEQIAGICLYQAGSVEHARNLAEDDPALREGRFVAQVMTWYTKKGALSWS